jgi:competence ComEA-like helix-hairpin-helix protein
MNRFSSLIIILIALGFLSLHIWPQPQLNAVECFYSIESNTVAQDVSVQEASIQSDLVQNAAVQTNKSSESMPDNQSVVNAIYDPVDAQYINIETFNKYTEEGYTHFAGIGKIIAERILAYREMNGPFEQFEALLEVKGIGEAKLNAILSAQP